MRQIGMMFCRRTRPGSTKRSSVRRETVEDQRRARPIRAFTIPVGASIRRDQTGTGTDRQFLGKTLGRSPGVVCCSTREDEGDEGVTAHRTGFGRGVRPAVDLLSAVAMGRARRARNRPPESPGISGELREHACERRERDLNDSARKIYPERPIAGTVDDVMETHDAASSLPIASSQTRTRWFCRYGCVVAGEGANQVFIGDTLLGKYDPRDRDLGTRNILLVMLAQEPKIHLVNLAAAFDISEEHLRRLRQAREVNGYGALLTRARGCAKRAAIAPAKVRELRALFEEGWNPTDATRRQSRRGRVSRSTVSRERRRWQAEKEAASGANVTTPVPVPAESQQRLLENLDATVGRERQAPILNRACIEDLEDVPRTNDGGVLDDAAADAETVTTEDVLVVEPSVDAMKSDGATVELAGEVVQDEAEAATADTKIAIANVRADESDGDTRVTESIAAADSFSELDPPEAGANHALANDERERGPIAPLRSRPVASGRLVQHVGSWLMMALAHQHGLHEEAERLGGDDAMRIAMDAVLAALAIGERTVEGVRRLATSTASLLLRCDHTPTANTIRRRLHAFADEHGPMLMARVGARYLDATRAEANEPAVFLVDNHLRTYTGQEVVRRGWRMQDKRAVPGASDYYVHDDTGRPVFRIDTPSHDSLCQWLMPIATRLREGLGPEERILLVFDRAGAFPVEMATLRDAGVEFVTYERRPYPDLAPSKFDRAVVVRGETYGVHESRLKNLGDGRGRVRRIALRTADGKQINLLAISTAPLEQLIAFLMGVPDPDAPSGRWQQENAFKHGAERWGINQLDGRKVESYPPGTIIPNPARRRNERALKIARADEGRARCALAAENLTDKRRARTEAQLVDAVQRRVALELARPLIPAHAPIEKTELAGKLVRHPAKLKAVIDTIRIVCANVEAELADIIAPTLNRPREAKKVIANVFAAPGRVDVAPSEIRIRLSPAANRSEHAAIRRLLADITARKLTLPGDIHRRPLRFELHLS